MAAGKTPAGTHRPILVPEIIDVLAPRPGDLAVDCTLGYGGHAEALLHRLQPGGRLIGLDKDPLELARTEERLRARGWSSEGFVAVKSNYAGLPQALARLGLGGANLILADLGVSSMQIDDPRRGFSVKHEGPLDMRMDPSRGPTAAQLLQRLDATALERALVEGADEPHARRLAAALAGRTFPTTTALATAVRDTLTEAGHVSPANQDLSVRRVFQALRILVNDEFSALDTLLRHLPACLAPGGRVAILTFHSGEDRRVKKAFEAGLASGNYEAITPEVIRPSAEELRANPRSSPAKLRWARRASSSSPSP